MNRIITLLVIAAVVVLFLITSMFYQINETEQVIITQFGKPVSEPITQAGLHVKMPYQTVRRFDKRVLEWDGEAAQIPTLEKRFILLDTTARWRIKEPLTFLQAVGNEDSAQSRLDDIIESAARDVISAYPLIQAVRNFQRVLGLESFEQGANQPPPGAEAPGSAANVVPAAQPAAAAPAPAVSELEPEQRIGRDKLAGLMLKRARENVSNLGIGLIDVRVKRINYVQTVEVKVYERMISERQRMAAQFRSEGDGESAKIRGEKERELDRINSEAYRQAQEIVGEGDAEAARIYAESYGADAEFYSFVQTLETYKHTMQDNASLLMTTESDFYRYLKEGARKKTMLSPPPPSPVGGGATN